eukprot:jgi/Tetstr1/456923/TSEL_043593.t1
MACVSSTTPTWGNDPRWCTPGIAETEAERNKLAADRASSAPVQAGARSVYDAGFYDIAGGGTSRTLADKRQRATLDQYRSLYCYGFYDAVAHAALNEAAAAIEEAASQEDATDSQLRWWAEESSRLVRAGALDFGVSSRYMSRVFLVPKPYSNKWRFVIDLRKLNLYRAVRKMLRFETLRRLRYLTCRGDKAFSFDMHDDGYYALGLREDIRDYFTINVRGTLWGFAVLSMG